MISKLLIADVNVSDEVKSLLEVLKEDSVLITYYDYSEGFVVNNQNVLVDKLLALIRSHLETTTVNFEHLCFINVEQMNTPMHSFKYNNQAHVISGIESKPEELESWNFMEKLVADIAKTTEIRNIDFIDIDHLCFPKEHTLIFDKIQEVTKDVEERVINYLKVAEDDKETIYNSDNWLHTMLTTFYSDENKVLIDKYFKVNNSNIGFLNTKTLKPRDLQIYESHVPSIDFESDAEVSVSIIPLHGYENDTDYDLMKDFIELLNGNTIVEFVYVTDTMEDFTTRLTSKINKYCGENKDKINKVNVGFWLNPNVDNPSLMLSNHISANIDQELLEVVNQLMANNTENVDQLKNHFIVKTSEALIEIFNMNVYDNMDVNTINFEIFNISDTFNTNYNLLCQFLHNDYFISTLVNFNLTFLSSSDNSENLFELHNKIEEFDEHGIVIDVSHNLFKDSQLMTDISNSEAYQDDMFITNISHINKSIQYNNSVNMAVYLKSDGPEIDKFMKPNIISNIILYDRELHEHLADVRECLLPNTLLLTFDKQNTYQDIKDGLLEINKLNGVQISNVALLQDNDSRSKTYNFVNEETCIVKYTSVNDPSLNTWSKFQEFVSFLENELKVKYFDLMMCKIYSNSNWNYVIDSISSNLTSLEIRSSENNTGHTMFEGDWILESPVVDVNMINLYFKESIKELDIQLGTNVNVSDYTKVGWMKPSHRFVHNKSGAWGPGSGPLFTIRCYTRSSSDYSFTSETPVSSTYTINFDNNTNILIPPTGGTNSYNYSDTESEPRFTQKTHSQSPGNLYIAFDDESNVDENTWFIPVTAIWNGMNHGTKNLTAFSHTDFWDSSDLAGHASLFGTFSPNNTDSIANGGTNMEQHPYAYFYVGPYTAYSGIPNPVPVPTPSEGMVFPKLTDSDSNEISGNLYVSGGKTYISYEITSTSTINLSHGLKNVDIFIVGGGGGGSGGGAGQGGGAGGVVVATGIDSITSGEHTITVGEGGVKGTSASSWASESGANSEAFGYIAIGGGRGGGTNSNGANGGSGGGNDGWPNHVYGRSVGYHSDSETFEFTGGSANYNNDSSAYPNVMIYGYNGGGSSRNAWNGTSAGGGGAGGAGGTGNNSNYHSGAGGVGMTNNFLNGIDKYYAGGGGGGNLHGNHNEGAGGNGGGGAGGNVPNSGSYSNAGIDGTPNTGGGGGGASAGSGGSGVNGGSGGSGIVIFRFVLAENENLPAVSSGTEDYSTKFYNYNSGEALVATEEQVVVGSIEPKLMDSNGDELTYNTYTENSIEYKSYVFTSVGTTSVSLSHDTPVDFMVLAGGGGGYTSSVGLYGGAGGGGVVVGTSYTFSNGNYDITVGDGGQAGGTGSNTQNGGTDGEDSSVVGSNLTFKALKGAGSLGPYAANSGGSSSGSYKKAASDNNNTPRAYDDDGNLFDFEVQTNYSNNVTKYPNVIVYGNKGGYGNTSYGWAGSGGGGAGSVGGVVSGTPGTNGDGNSVGGKGGNGLANTFVDGTTQYYGAGGAGVAGSASFGPNSDGPGLGGTPIGVDAPANTGAGGSGQTRSQMPGASSDATSAGGSGIVVIRFPKTANEYETKAINSFAESTTAYLNYDISGAEIKKYVAPVSTGGNTFGDISNVPEDFVFSTTQNAGTFTHGTTISITDTLETSDDPNNNKSYTFTLSSNSVITELNFTPTNYSGDYTSLYYVIQENTNSIVKKSDDTLQDENFIESQVDFSNGTQDLLQVGDTKVIIENNTNQKKDYVLLFYTLEGTVSVLFDSGKLNRYLYDGYGSTEYTNVIPGWSYFSNYNSSALVTNTSIPNHGDYYNYLFDGYVYYTETTTKHFGTTGDDDTFIWIVEGDKKWSTVGHPHRASYSWITSNIPNATLVCYRAGRGGPNSTYTGTMVGSYTFQANTLYTILMKFTEHTGGINFSFGISNSSLNNQSRRTTTFPSQFHATVGVGGIAEGSSIEYSITSDSISEPVVEDVSSQIVSLNAGVYNIVVDKPAPPVSYFKHVVLQRMTHPTVYEPNAYAPQNNFMVINEVQLLDENGTNILSSGSGAALWTIDFQLTDNVGSWTDGYPDSATAATGPNAMIDGNISGTPTRGNNSDQSVYLSWAVTLPTETSVNEIKEVKLYQANENLQINSNYGDLRYRSTGFRFLFFDASYNLVLEGPEITTPEDSYTFAFDEFAEYKEEVPDVSENIVVDLSTNTITSNVDFEIKYTPIDLSLSELTKDTTINPVRSQTIPFVKSGGVQEERSVTLHGDATYNRFTNEYYFPGDLSGYASFEGELFGEHAMSMSFMYKSGGEQPALDPSGTRNTITYIGHPYPSPLNQNAHDTNDFAIYSSPNDQASIFYKEGDTSIKDVPTTTFDNSSNYTHIAITMNEDLTLNETNGFKLYVDGTLTKSGNLSANNGALISGVTQPLQLLGKGPLAGSSQSSAFKGYLKNVRFYDHVLSQSQVSTIYTNMITNEYTDNKNFVSQTVPNLVISSSDISSGDHTELTSISMDITATPDSSLNITSSDINVTNGAISNFTNDTTNTWSFTFTPTSSNIKSSVSISENSLLDNIVNNMADKPSWFTTNNNHASNVFEFLRTNVEMDLMPPLQNQTIAMITSNGSHVEIPVTLNGNVTYDASKNEYDISENGYLSIDEDVIRDGDLTISLMHAMRIGNQYGNDQLVNFSDTNSLNTSTDSTDIHIFRDGTTPGAWFYYGSPDDNGMAISEAGLEPSLVNTQVTQQGEFDATDLQMEYIANTTATESNWTSVYTNNAETATTSASNVPSDWVLGSDSDGDYYTIKNGQSMKPNYPNINYILSIDTAGSEYAGGITYEVWVKLPTGASVGNHAWIIGIETDWGPFLALNPVVGIGGIGMTPYSTDENGYNGLPNPGLITDYHGDLVHVIGYMYRDTSSTHSSHPQIRGVWVNGNHFTQETTQQAGKPDRPKLDSLNNPFEIGRGLGTESDNIQIYSFRVWHRQLTGDEVAKLYSWGPQGSVISPPQITTGGLASKYTHMAITVKEGQVKRFYINGEVVDYVNKYRSNAIPVSRPIVGGKRQYQSFGYGYAANRGFSGLMKNIRIYNKALTAYEVRHLYAINSKFNDNDFSNTVVIPVPRPTLTFISLDISSGSSLVQSTLDLKLTASDDGLDGNITASDIITSNGTITAFSQSSPTTWDLTYTSDYNKQSNVGSLFIEQDTIYNNDVSDIMVPQIETQNFGNSAQTTILNNSYNIIGTPSFGWPVLGGNYAVGATNVGGIAGGPIFANPSSGSEPHYVCIFDGGGGGGTIKYSYFNISSGVYSHKFRGYKINFDKNTDYFQNYIDNITTSQLTDIFAGTDFTGYDNGTYYVLAIIQSITSQTQPEPWWTREHNKASNKFEWTALNSGASDTSTTPTRPSITFASPDLNHGESQNFGTISMTIYVSSNNLNITQADLSFSNGVVSDFTKVANNYYTFNFKSASVSQPSIIEILQDTVSNAETSNDFNETSNTFEWTWGFTISPPDVTITSSDVTHGGNFGGQQVNMILEFSSEVLHGNSVESTFSQFDVSATNGYVYDVSAISQSQISFKLGSSSITESTSVFIPQNIISRTFNDIYTVNSNNTSNVFTWSYDSADLTISSLVVNDANGNTISPGDNINGNELWMQFTFSESIYNFDKSYFNVTNCKITNISTDTTFTAFTIKAETYFPTSAIIELQSNKLITAGRGLQKYIRGSSNLSFNWNYDNTRPKISMTSSQASGLTNNVSFVDLSFVSTMDTSDFTISSIQVTGHVTLSLTAISSTEYLVRVTPLSVTTINITLPENAYTEQQYGNGNENSVSFNWTYDNIPPTVDIFSPDIANGASSSDPYINIYFTLSKPVDDFVLSDDANVVNGTLGAMTKTNTFVNHTTSFNVTVATKTASHPYNGNGSSAGYFLNGVESPTIDFIVGQTYTFDQSDSTNATHPLKFYTTAEKDQIYTSGVVYTDNAGTSGAITTITIDENTPSPLYYQCLNHGYMGFKGEVSKKGSYTAKLYPTQNDTVSIFIFAGSITDSAGNTNATDSNEFDWIFDSNDLLTTLSSSDVTNNGTFANDSITLSLATTAEIVDFVEADISYENGTISNVDASAKTFTITSNAQGVPTTAFIIGGAVETSLGEPNIESNLFTWTYNPPIPKLVITSSQINEGDYTNISSIDFILTFDQAAVVFDQNSLTLSNCTISSFSGSGTTYQVSVNVPLDTDDAIRLTLPQGGAHVVDNGTHENDVSYYFEWYYDSIAPVITIGSSFVSEGELTNLTGLNLTVTSSEKIKDLRLSDFDVSNAVVSNLSDTSGTSFTMSIQPLDDTTDCSINIFLKDNSVTDRAGNANSQSNTFAFSYEFFSSKEDSSAIEQLFDLDDDIPDEDKLSSSEIDLVISAAFTIPDTASPFAVAATENSNAGGNNTSDDNNTSTTRNPTFVKPPKITIPPEIKIRNRKVFTKLIDQIFATASESVKTLTIDKSSVAVSAAADEQIAEVEEVVMVKSNQLEALDMGTLIEDPTKPSATYIPLANVNDFAIITIDGVTYTTRVESEGIFALTSDNGGAIDNPNSVDGKWRSNDIYQATNINKIIFGSQIISTDPVAPEPPTLTIASGQVSNGGTTDISYIDLSFVFSTSVEISLNSIEPLNANTLIISRTIESIDSSNSYISVTVAPIDASANNTIGVFVDVSAFYDTNNTFNDVQYTYSWNYSLDGGGSGSGQFIPCFLEGTRILTTNGYKNIELLHPKKDKLLDKDNKPLNFLDIQKYLQENNGKQYPYKIPCGSELSAEYTCNDDLYLTYNHCVYLPHLNKYAPVSAMKHLKEDKTLTQKKFTYYHIFTENYFSDTIMANGIPCESHSKYTFEKLRNIDPSCKLLKNVIKKAEMLPNCMRNRLSIKETKQIIKKFQSKQNKKKAKQMKKK